MNTCAPSLVMMWRLSISELEIEMYFIASFGYNGPKAGAGVGGEECAHALEEANSIVERKMSDEDLCMGHAYCWPDGSLYKYFLHEDGGRLRSAVESALKHTGITLLELDEVPADHDPHKFGFETLEEYMAGEREKK